MLRFVQSFLIAQGIELRKAPARQVAQLPVFQLAIGALMQASTRPLRFVQVGANDGVYGDPLRAYVERHLWHGILVEPQPDVFARLVENYRGSCENLIFENVAISPDEPILRLYRVPGQQVLPGQKIQDALTVTSTNPSVVARQGGVSEDRLESVDVPALRLDALIIKHGFQDFDLLQVDCEGFDGEVIRSLDLNRFRPSLIQFEHGHMRRKDLAATEELLSSHGYRFLYGGRFADSLAMAGECIDRLI
jgi:FkbM family methyltransferase